MKPQALAIRADNLTAILKNLGELYPELKTRTQKTETGEAHTLEFQTEDQAATFMELLNVNQNLLYFAPREHIETDEDFRQLLPYVLVYGSDEGSVLGYNRPGKGKGEDRLKGAFSIGFGGHVEIKDWYMDMSATDLLSACADRELAEELGENACQQVPRLPSAILIDDTNPVGRVHLGLVYQTTVKGEFNIDSTEVENLVWLTRKEVSEGDRSKTQNPENWTAMLLNIPLPGVVTT